MTPVIKNGIVVDHQGNETKAICPKRAKGLAKKAGRASRMKIKYALRARRINIRKNKKTKPHCVAVRYFAFLVE